MTLKEQKKWEVISHTADYAFRIYGKSLEELINNSYLAFTKSIFQNSKGEKRSVSETTLRINSYEPALLIIDFLRELHSLIESDNIYPLGLKLVKLNETELVAYLNYRRISPEDNLHISIKAVTYHKASILKKDDIFTMDIVCDV